MDPFGIAMLFVRVLRHIRRRRYTVVHTHNSITGAVGRVAARLARVPVVIHTTHGFHFHDDMSALRRWPFVAAERWLARRCDLLLCQSREEVGVAQRIRLRPKRGIVYVGNGINLDRFAPRPALPDNARPVLLCVGRIEPVKNHPMLFRALAILRRTHDVVLKLVGDGPLEAQYRDDLARAGLAEAVEFLGYRYDVPELTAAADVVVLTSLKEGIPRALMQAAAVGVPAVATDVKGTREVIVDGVTGYLVPLGDAEALAGRLGALLDSAALRREMGARAAAPAREHFDERRVAERLLRIYRAALAGPGEIEVVSAAPARGARRSGGRLQRRERAAARRAPGADDATSAERLHAAPAPLAGERGSR
jgi:glycosyltransferase involved in cell wall biosynthesis